jgi:hypothetical protein
MSPNGSFMATIELNVAAKRQRAAKPKIHNTCPFPIELGKAYLSVDGKIINIKSQNASGHFLGSYSTVTAIFKWNEAGEYLYQEHNDDFCRHILAPLGHPFAEASKAWIAGKTIQVLEDDWEDDWEDWNMKYPTIKDRYFLFRVSGVNTKWRVKQV